MDDIQPGGSEPQDDSLALHRALLESRQRWREFGAIATDLAFETDAEGRLTFVAPDTVLGWPAATLLGRKVAELLADPDGVPDPFRFTVPLRRRNTWIRRADGGSACLAITSVPVMSADGQRSGVRGVGVDVTTHEQAEVRAAAALRRGEVLDHILNRMRQEVLAPRMMVAVLDALVRALGAEGACVINLLNAPDVAPIIHQVGAAPGALLAAASPMLHQADDAPQPGRIGDVPAMTCPASTRFGDRAGLLVWRGAGGRDWDADDTVLASSVTGVIRIVLEHEAIQRELARQARTDPLTGLLNRRAFLEEASRRIDRLDREEVPGTLIFIDLDRLKPLNDRLGHEAGDSALVLTGALLRRTVRGSDLVARLGGDEFALWLDGADELAAAERAEHLRLSYPAEMAHFTAGEEAGLSMSVGIACRQPGSGEELDRLIQRADQAMYEAKRSGRGRWRVSHSPVMA